MKIHDSDSNSGYGDDNIDEHMFDLNGLNLDGSPHDEESEDKLCLVTAS